MQNFIKIKVNQKNFNQKIPWQTHTKILNKDRITITDFFLASGSSVALYDTLFKIVVLCSSWIIFLH